MNILFILGLIINLAGVLILPCSKTIGDFWRGLIGITLLNIGMAIAVFSGFYQIIIIK